MEEGRHFATMERVYLKDLPEYNEDMVQEYIFENPDVLGLGDVSGYVREKKQRSGGRVDMILEGKGDDDEDTWYEVEIQLGSTDESHIIRTIEYWDNERWTYPQFNHIAVLIAENVTGRFFNVISLFNKHIPLIAYQMSAFRTKDGEVVLTFAKVLDLVAPEVPDEAEYIVDYRERFVSIYGEYLTDLAERIFNDILPEDRFRMKYTKEYIGVQFDGRTKNFIELAPRIGQLVFRIKAPHIETYDEAVDELGQYDENGRYYWLYIKSFEEYQEKKPRIAPLILSAAKQRGVPSELLNIDAVQGSEEPDDGTAPL